MNEAIYTMRVGSNEIKLFWNDESQMTELNVASPDDWIRCKLDQTQLMNLTLALMQFCQLSGVDVSLAEDQGVSS